MRFSSLTSEFPHGDFNRAVEFVRSYPIPAQRFALVVREFRHYRPVMSGFPEVVIENNTPYRNNFPQDVRAAAAMTLMSDLLENPDDPDLRSFVTAMYAAAPDALIRLYEITGLTHFCFPASWGIALRLDALRIGLGAYGHLERIADRVQELRRDVVPVAARMIRGVPEKAAASPSAAFCYLFQVLTGNPRVREVAESEARQLVAGGEKLRRGPFRPGWGNDPGLWEIIAKARSVYRNINHSKRPPTPEEEAIIRAATRRMVDLLQDGAVGAGHLVANSFPKGCPALTEILYAALPAGARGASQRKFAELLPISTLEKYRTGASTAEEAMVRAEAGSLDIEKAISEIVLPVIKHWNTAIVLDASGSMEPAVRSLNTLMTYISRITKKFEKPIRLVIVGSSVTPKVSVMVLSKPQTFGIRCDGRTPLYQGIRLALEEAPGMPRPNMLIVLTDWDHNVPGPLDAWLGNNQLLLSGTRLSPQELDSIFVVAINFRGGEPPQEIQERVISIQADEQRPERTIVAMSEKITSMFVRNINVLVRCSEEKINITLEV